MRSRLCALVMVSLSLLLTGCPGSKKNELPRVPTQPDPKPNPPGPTNVVCPVSQIPRDQLRDIVDRVRAISARGSFMNKDKQLVRAGYLSSELSQAGVPEEILLASFSNGTFAALITWLGDDPPSVDFLNKFANCEENKNE